MVPEPLKLPLPVATLGPKWPPPARKGQLARPAAPGAEDAGARLAERRLRPQALITTPVPGTAGHAAVLTSQALALPVHAVGGPQGGPGLLLDGAIFTLLGLILHPLVV